ncbi:MAG: glycosyltransferase family 9 protein [Bryobacteraceae bacterium]
MSDVWSRLKPGERVAIVRLRSLGDCVLTTPAIHLLKNARPDLEIAVVVETRFAAIFEGNPDIAAILSPDVKAIRNFHPAVCLNLHGGGSSARLTALSGARYRAGFAHFRPNFVYNVKIPAAQRILGVHRTVHTAEHLASAIFHLGIPVQEIPRARLFPDGTRHLKDIAQGISRPYAVIHPMASHPSKTWPAAWFLNVARHIVRSLELTPVFIAGPGEDLSPFQAWQTVSNAPLPAIKSLLSEAALFAGNDSGPAHMAAAFGTPVVVLFGSSDPVIWAPWKTAARVLTANGPIHNITERSVIEALDRLAVHA